MGLGCQVGIQIPLNIWLPLSVELKISGLRLYCRRWHIWTYLELGYRQYADISLSFTDQRSPTPNIPLGSLSAAYPSHSVAQCEYNSLKQRLLWVQWKL